MDTTPGDPFLKNRQSMPPIPPPVSNAKRVPVETAAAFEQVSKDSVPKTASQTDIVIQTMKSDLEDIRKTPKAEKKAQSQDMPPKPIDNVGSAVPATFSVAKGESQQKKVIVPPVASRSKKRSPLKVIFAVLTVFVLLAAASGAAWYFLGDNTGLLQPVPEEVAGTPKQLVELIPASATIIVEFDARDEAKKLALFRAWDAYADTQPSLVTFLAGDPRFLLSEAYPGMQFAYVVLPNDSRPFIIVPKNQITEQLFSTSLQGRYVEDGGWYIAHALSAEGYAAALRQGIMNDTHAQQLGTHAVRYMLSEEVVTGLTKEIAGSSYVPLSASRMSLVSDMQLFQTGLALTGLADSIPETRVPDTLEQNLLVSVPQQVSLVRMGSNLATDTLFAQQVGAFLDTAVIERPAVKQLISELQQSYVYYQREAESGITDLGIIISLPEPVKKTLVMGDPVLEEALLALTPALTGQQQTTPLAFSEAIYKDQPLRFVNITAQSALDYAIIGDKLVIATSKEGMLALLDTVLGETPSIADAPFWSQAAAYFAPISTVTSMVIANTASGSSLLGSFLPGATGETVLFGIGALQSTSGDTHDITGVLLPQATVAN